VAERRRQVHQSRGQLALRDASNPLDDKIVHGLRLIVRTRNRFFADPDHAGFGVDSHAALLAAQEHGAAITPHPGAGAGHRATVPLFVDPVGLVLRKPLGVLPRPAPRNRHPHAAIVLHAKDVVSCAPMPHVRHRPLAPPEDEDVANEFLAWWPGLFTERQRELHRHRNPIVAATILYHLPSVGHVLVLRFVPLRRIITRAGGRLAARKDDPMDSVRWGMIGCGDVAEVKSGPALQKASGSALVAVMRRDAAKAADYAARHGVPRHYHDADALIADPGVDAVYIATPPSSHCELALRVAHAGKPCLVEKPMALNHAECFIMVEAFEARHVPLFVAYYRRALTRFVSARELLRAGAIGKPTSIHICQFDRLLQGEAVEAWRVDPAVAGAGLFLDLASHGFDLLDYLLGPIVSVAGFATNTGGAYRAEDVTTASFLFESGVAGTGAWNFNADRNADGIVVTGSDGEMHMPVFANSALVVRKGGSEEVLPFHNPPHVHQPLIQTVVDELLGRGRCESTGRSAARASWVMDRCVARYYRRSVPPEPASPARTLCGGRS
jgi:1,5-anhydro-D-fructose reductase (1,5-anhydro-D-mannitol-forming)